MKSSYVLNVVQGQENSAGSKAKQDVTSILINQGFQPLDFKVPDSKLLRVIKSKSSWRKVFSDIETGLFICQYPMYSRFSSLSLMRVLRGKNGVKKIAIIHDVESIRGFKKDRWTNLFETKFLNQFDCLIVHNQKMQDWLKEHQIQTEMVNLNIFDYLTTKKMLSPDLSDKIVFAGNLEKASFLEKLDIQTKVNVFGPNKRESYPQNISYCGLYSPDELPEHLNGSFGLVWDGTSIQTCDGMYGKYLKYNDPHKTSLYLSSGIPVIVWEQSAMADFILKNGLGLVVESLSEIDNRLKCLSEQEYQGMLKNVGEIASKLRHGVFLTHAVHQAIQIVNASDTDIN